MVLLLKPALLARRCPEDSYISGAGPEPAFKVLPALTDCPLNRRDLAAAELHKPATIASHQGDAGKPRPPAPEPKGTAFRYLVPYNVQVVKLDELAHLLWQSGEASIRLLASANVFPVLILRTCRIRARKDQRHYLDR